MYSNEERENLLNSYDDYVKELEEKGIRKNGKIIGNPFNKDKNGHYRYNKPYIIDKNGYRID